MKKTIITLAVAVLATASAFAQNLSVGAGYTNYNFATKIGDGDASKGDPFSGFYAGADAAIYNKNNFAITPGIYFAYASCSKTASIGSLASATGTTKEMYLDIPVNFSYGIDFGFAKVFAYAGPTFSLGASSTSEVSAESVIGGGKTDPVDNYGDNSNYGRFDVLIGGGLGIDISCIRITAGYNYGLLDRNTTDNVKYNRSGLHAGVAYLF